MYKIFKSITVHDTPVVIVNKKKISASEIDEAVLESADSELGDDDSDVVAEAVPISPEQVETLSQEYAEVLEQLKKESHDEGYSMGYRDGLEQVRQAIDDAAVRAQNIIAASEQQATQILLASEEQMVEIAIAVARKIINRELIETSASVLPMVKVALSKVQDQNLITLRVSPANLDEVMQAKQDLLANMSHDVSLSIVPDDGFREGDCVVETSFGAVDARIDTQLDILKESLRDAVHG